MHNIQHCDLAHNWHPCSQMRDHQESLPMVIKKARGCYIELQDGSRLIDAISSWWCKSLGHGHPHLQQALQTQLAQFEHVIFANTTHEVIAKLGTKLTQLFPSLQKIFYAGDGSCAIEIAMKMSVHSRVNQGQPQRHRFAALCNGYHGETIAALSVSDLGLYKQPYQHITLPCFFIPPLYVSSQQDAAWGDASEHWQGIEKSLEPMQDTLTAIILEPILQGAGGMRLYSQDFLRRLVNWAQQRNIHIIADEIMTGIGRSGKMLACQHADINPDFLCLSKGLTSGFMPFSAVMTTDDIYAIFYDDYKSGRAFLHSHTYSGHALGASVALAALEVMEAENIMHNVSLLEINMLKYIQKIADSTGMLHNIRGIGAVIAADLKLPRQIERAGFQLAQCAARRRVLLRPLGNSVYWLPPLNMSATTLEELAYKTQQALCDFMQQHRL